MITIPLSLLLIHFVGDFMLQTDWMAVNKSKRLDALCLHAFIYSICFLGWGWPFVAITFVSHFLTDVVTSRITSRLWFFQMEPGIWQQAPHTFPIGADQLIHYMTLALTLRWIS